ncbi:MAG: response regulator transcription factor [Dehalococcoidia bacterium]|nr:response regulator transcription factor [Dehalococcoidia bacterium]
MKVLIIEDDPQIIEAVSLAFQIRWPEAQLIATQEGERGAYMVETEKPDVVVLDLGLPDISGYDVLKQIRLFSDVPVLILTVRADEPDIIKGLEWGADDYMTKPFRQLELLARVKSLLRRRSPVGGEQTLVCGQLRLNPVTFQLFIADREVNLTRTEGIILHQLVKNAGQIVEHSTLAEAVWGEDYPDAAQSIKVYIRRLREKLEADPGEPQLILTKPGIGYVFARQC